MDCSQHQQSLLEIKKLFAEAEGICKKVETNTAKEGGVVIPAINQLRYAGQHLLEACTSIDKEVQKNQILKAKNHCCRAIYDAAEAACLFVKREIDDLREQYKEVMIGDIVHNYSQTLENYSKLQRLIGCRREDIEKIEHYRELAQIYFQLDEGVNTLISHEEELKKAQQKIKLDNNQQLANISHAQIFIKQGWIRIIIAILVGSISTLGILQFFND